MKLTSYYIWKGVKSNELILLKVVTDQSFLDNLSESSLLVMNNCDLLSWSVRSELSLFYLVCMPFSSTLSSFFFSKRRIGCLSMPWGLGRMSSAGFSGWFTHEHDDPIIINNKIINNIIKTFSFYQN